MPAQIERDRLIHIPEVLKITGLGRSSLYNRIGRDLRPVKQGKRTLFSEREVYAYVQRQLAERGAQSAA